MPAGDPTPRTPAAPSASAAPGGGVSCVQTCVVLVDWWLERVAGDVGKICVSGHTDTAQTRMKGASSKGNMKGPVRKYTSGAVVRRYDHTTIECASGFLIRIGRPLNSSRTRENGFPDKVCQRFQFGFPVGWNKVINPSAEQMNKHTNNHMDHMASALRENGADKCTKTSVNLGTTDALEEPTEPMTPQPGVVLGSEDNTVRRLRSGKIFGISSNAPLKRSYNKQRPQQKESNTKMLPHEGIMPTADTNSRKNGCSAGTVAADELQSHDSHSEGGARPTKKRGRPPKR